MPTATNRGVEVAYERAGDGEIVAFVPTLGYGAWQWAWQVPAVAGPFEAVAMELRGTGRSASAPDSPDAPSGPHDVPTLADDLEAVLADVGARRAHLVGFGLGGHVALEHAARYDRARSLTLLATSPGAPEADPPSRVVGRLAASRDDPEALRATLDPVLSAAFREQHPDVLEGIAEWRAEEDAPLASWRAQAPAFESWERDWPPYEVTLPTLVVQGTADEIVSPANAAALVDLLPRAERERFEGAGHLVTVERSRPLNDRLLGFLEANAGD